MAAGGGRKAILAALFANAGIAVAKFVAFLVTASASMLAESIHSVADTSNQALLLLGGRRARRGPTDTHPFGYGRERYFWSFIVALVLFSLGGLFALYEGWQKLQHPHELSSIGWAIGVLLLAIVLESFSLRTAVQEANNLRGDDGWVDFIRHSRVPEIPVVLLEDLGALIGLFFALIGVSLAVITGDPAWDAIGTISIGVLLVVIAVILVIEMKSLLIGEAASPVDRRRIEEAITTDPGISRLLHLRTQHLGPEEVLVAAKVSLNDERVNVGQLSRIIDRCEERIRTQVPSVRIVYLEPDTYDPGAAPGEEQLDE